MTPVLIMAAGLAIGLEHAFETDHIAAIAVQVSKKKTINSISTIKRLKKSVLASSVLGVFWGAGHTTTLVLVGLLVFVLSINIPQNIFSNLEIIVGIMLVFLGTKTYLNKSIFKTKHIHPHVHEGGIIHTHDHKHDGIHKHGHKSYIIGCIHGLAGSGSLVVFVAASLGSLQIILPFILIFGIGSILGMAMISGIIGLPFAFTANINKVSTILRYIAGSASLLIGINIIYKIGVLQHLFGI